MTTQTPAHRAIRPSLLDLTPGATPNRRLDIQALRGLAVLLVLIYHARIGGIAASGYLGVDIFFVLSGYLITGIVRRAIEDGTFSFASFYYRRAKRLLPAAYVTFVLTTLAATQFLTQQELHDFLKQLIGAITFTGNIVLWRQVGYFDGAAELKPLLHVWSLSLEEQYYLLLPAALVFTPRRFWTIGASALLLLSAALYIFYGRIDPSATFYLLPTRAWELGLGSIAVIYLEGSTVGRFLQRFFWPALVVVLTVPFLTLGQRYPGLDALLVCIATLIIVLRHHATVGTSLPTRGLAWVGDMSYSLYLVHWPLFAFASSAWVSATPLRMRLLLTVSALIFGYLLYRFVEKPVRHAPLPLGRRSVLMFAAASVAVVALGFILVANQQRSADQDFTQMQRSNVGFDKACESKETFLPRTACISGEHPAILVWGDSHAMHLVEGIAATTNAGLVQATKSACGPFLDLSYVSSEGTHNQRWAEGCIAFNRSVLDYLARTPEIRTVVLASVVSQYLPGSRVFDTRQGERDGEMAAAVAALSDTVQAVRAIGRRVVFVGSMPMSEFNVGRCLELVQTGKYMFGADTPNCSIDEARYREHRSDALRLLDSVEKAVDLPVIRLDSAVCHAGQCETSLDGVLLYRDWAHLSYDGSRKLAIRLGLGDLILRTAR